MASKEVAAILVDEWRNAHDRHGWAIGRYVIMPDHLYLFVCGSDDFELGRWIGVLKQNLAKQIEHSGRTSVVWQRGFFDHLLRSDESYAQKWNYVRENPVRAGLVARPEDWPYQGELNILRW